MNEAFWIHANLEGRARWYIALDRGDSVYFPEIDFEEDMDLETYQAEFPHFEVRAIPTVEQWDKMCALAEKRLAQKDSTRLTDDAVNGGSCNDGELGEKCDQS